MFTLPKNIPLLLPSFAWVLGLLFARLEFISFSYILLLLFFLVLPWWFKLWRKLWYAFLCAGLLFGAISLAWQVYQTSVDESWLGQKINIQAQVADIRNTSQYTRLRLKNIQRDDGQKLGGKIDVYVYRQQLQLLPGMQVAITVKLHTPRNKKNPAYFDYARYMFEQGVSASGSVSGAVQALNHQVSWLEQARQNIRHVLSELDKDKQGVLLALLLADRSQIPLDIDDAFAASGATHLLAISGLHMGLVAGWGFILAWWFITRREAWIVRFPVRSVALGVGMLLALTYATIAGFPIPAQRAFLMLLAGVVAWSMRSQQVPLNTLFVALLLITLFDPASVFSISLWLSFAATAALLIWADKHSQQFKLESMYAKAWMWFKGMFWVSIIASLATLPLIGYVFERLPTWSLLVNALLVPLYAFWVLPLALIGEVLALLGLPAWASEVFAWSGVGIGWGNVCLLWIQTLPLGDVWLRADLPWLFALLAMLLLAAGVLWLQTKRLLASLLLLVSLVAYAGLGLSERSVQSSHLYVWDVGQGASALLQTSDKRLLIDAPGKRGSKFNGGTIAAQNMRKLGLLQLDVVVLTHAQSDHAGGLARLLSNLNYVDEVWLADVPENHVYFKDVVQQHHVRWLKRGDNFRFGEDASIEVLWPPLDYAPSNSNNASLVLLVDLGSEKTDSGETDSRKKLLFTGDMQAPVERKILEDLASVDVMLMPHHGSNTSSTAVFVQKVRPKIVIAQTGYKNRYNFPKAEVVQRYQDVGSQVYNTADGAVIVIFDDEGFGVK